MPHGRILVVDAMHESLLPLLQKEGFEVDYQPAIAVGDIAKALEGAVGLVIRSKTRVNAALLKHAHALKWVARAGAGLDNIDHASLAERQLALINAPEGNRDAVGEHALGMLLALFNNLVQAHNQVTQGTWDREGNRGVELMGKTVGIVGYGHMGQAVARRLSGFGVRIMAYDKYKTGYGTEKVWEVSEEELFSEADIITWHVPLTAETQGMVNANYLGQLRKPVYVLNTARGGILHLAALREALAEGKVLGAALDVLENEKLGTLDAEEKASFEYLAQHPRVLLSPHVGGWTHESYRKINEVLVRKILHYHMEGHSR